MPKSPSPLLLSVLSLFAAVGAGCGWSPEVGNVDAGWDPIDGPDVPDGPRPDAARPDAPDAPPPDALPDAPSPDAPPVDACLAAGGRIVFTTDRAGGDADIAIMIADGTNVDVLTDNSWLDAMPQASADRTRLAWLAAPAGELELDVARLDGSNRRTLVGGSLVDVPPRWSPDGGRLAFTSRRDGNTEVYAIDADGAGLVDLSRDPAVDTAPAWSPDGARIAFVSERGITGDDPALRENRIFTMAADGTDLVALAPTERGEWSALAWSPDGHRLAGIVRTHDDFGGPGIRTRLVTMTAVGDGATRIGRPEVRDFAWSPDGTRLAFTQNGDLYTASPVGAGLVQLSFAGLDRTPAWSPDGSGIAFVSLRDGNAEVYRMRADGTAMANLTDDPAADASPVWLPCE